MVELDTWLARDVKNSILDDHLLYVLVSGSSSQR